MGAKQALMEKVKRNRGLAQFYRCCGNAAVSIMKLFIIPDPYLILFNSYGGKKYDDSPKAIYLEMQRDPRFKDYKLVWAFHNPGEHVDIDNKIKTDGFHYFVTALKARCWISNSSIKEDWYSREKRHSALTHGMERR